LYLRLQSAWSRLGPEPSHDVTVRLLSSNEDDNGDIEADECDAFLAEPRSIGASKYEINAESKSVAHEV
jgi:hypothetical protein